MKSTHKDHVTRQSTCQADDMFTASQQNDTVLGVEKVSFTTHTPLDTLTSLTRLKACGELLVDVLQHSASEWSHISMDINGHSSHTTCISIDFFFMCNVFVFYFDRKSFHRKNQSHKKRLQLKERSATRFQVNCLPLKKPSSRYCAAQSQPQHK